MEGMTLVGIQSRLPIDVGDEVMTSTGLKGTLVGVSQYGGGVRVRFSGPHGYAETVYSPCVINAEWVKLPKKWYQVITSDLHELPLCIINAEGEEALFEQLAMWDTSGWLDNDLRAMIREELRQAKPPNDALLGMSVTRQFALGGGLRVHICFGD